MTSIYLIDDQAIVNYITKKLLQVNGFQGEIHEFTNPAKALQIILKQKRSIIFLDLNMPQMNGWEFLNILKEKNVCHCVIILTSSCSELDRNKAKEYPCVIEYLIKPLKKEKLSHILKLAESKV